MSKAAPFPFSRTDFGMDGAGLPSRPNHYPPTGAMSHRDGSGKIKPRLKMIAPPSSHPFNNRNKGGTSALDDAKRNPDRGKIVFSATVVQYVNL